MPGIPGVLPSLCRYQLHGECQALFFDMASLAGFLASLAEIQDVSQSS
jgi:hypothetical protein